MVIRLVLIYKYFVLGICCSDVIIFNYPLIFLAFPVTF